MVPAEQVKLPEQVQGPLQHHQASLVHPHRAHERMLPQAVNEGLATHDDPSLAGADQFVSTGQNHIRTRLDGLPDRRFMGQPELFQVN